MSVLSKMEARLADPTSDKGTPCGSCHESALACQVEFLSSGERQWCCRWCGLHGARVGHRAK